MTLIFFLSLRIKQSYHFLKLKYLHFWTLLICFSISCPIFCSKLRFKRFTNKIFMQILFLVFFVVDKWATRNKIFCFCYEKSDDFCVLKFIWCVETFFYVGNFHLRLFFFSSFWHEDGAMILQMQRQKLLHFEYLLIDIIKMKINPVNMNLWNWYIEANNYDNFYFFNVSSADNITHSYQLININLTA